MKWNVVYRGGGSLKNVQVEGKTANEAYDAFKMTNPVGSIPVAGALAVNPDGTAFRTNNEGKVLVILLPAA
jgi:hypothetical protein